MEGILRSGYAANADAIVIVPPADTEVLWNELARLARQGVYLVVVDTKPPNARFAGVARAAPSFVGSDFCQGGVLVGHYIREALESDPEAQAVVALGPDSAWPAMERSRALTLELCRHGLAGRTTFVELASWKEKESADALIDQVERLRTSHPNMPLLVFCGNDKVLEQVDIDLVNAHDVRLMGYDGTIDETERLVMNRCRHAVATIDTQPKEQGLTAGQLLVEEHMGSREGRAPTYVKPRLVVK